MPSELRAGFTYGDECGDGGHLLELLEWRPAWHADAACREHPEITWFPARGESADPAKAVCAGCAAVGDCRAWALTQSHLAGVWGGLSEQERRNGVTSAGRSAACRARARARRQREADDRLLPAAAALLARLA